VPGTRRANMFQKRSGLTTRQKTRLNDPRTRDYVYLPETHSVLAVEFSSIAIVACNHLGTDYPKTRLSSPRRWYPVLYQLESSKDDWGTGLPLFPVCPNKNKTKQKHKKSKADSERESERTKGKSQTLLYLAYTFNVSKAVQRRRTLLQIK